MAGSGLRGAGTVGACRSSPWPAPRHAAAALNPVLDVIDHNRAALALYEQLGWRIAGSLELELADRPERLVCYVAP